MSFKISRETTPILAEQSTGVQSLGTQFNAEYTSKRSIQDRDTLAKLLVQIKNSDLICVNSLGQQVTGANRQAVTFVAICRELGIGRSYAYQLIDEYTCRQEYPQAIQEAAAEAGFNLALSHVLDAYKAMSGIPVNPNPFEARGVVAQLQKVKPSLSSRAKKTTEEKLIYMFKELFDFTGEEELDSGFIRFCMIEAAKSLSKTNLETWQAVSHELALDEKAVRAVVPEGSAAV